MTQTEYKHEDYIYFVEEQTGEFEEVFTESGSKRKRAITRMRNIEFDAIDSLDLDIRGEQVPFTSKHVINTPLYVLYYWSPIIGDRACHLYLQLLTYCRDEKDFLWDKLKELEFRCNMSRPTLNKNLDILEKHNFIIRVRRLNKLNNNKETSPVIKVRQTIPLLSKDLYRKLPKESQEKHDKFMEKYGKRTEMEEFTYSVNETKGEMLVGSEVRVTKRMKSKVDKLLSEDKAMNYILTKLSFSEEAKQQELHNLMQDSQYGISKPSFDKVYSESLSFYNESTNTVDLVLGSDGMMMVELTGLEAQCSRLNPIFEELYDVTDFEIKFYSYEDYMLKLERD